MLFLIVYLLKVYYVHHVLIWLPERREIIDYNIRLSKKHSPSQIFITSWLPTLVVRLT